MFEALGSTPALKVCLSVDLSTCLSSIYTSVRHLSLFLSFMSTMYLSSICLSPVNHM